MIKDLAVIIPSYNYSQYLDKCLSSIINDQKNKYKIFLMDGGSNVQTQKIIQKWKKKIYFLRIKKDKGQVAAINEAAKLSNTKYICWINSDDYYLPNGLDNLYETIKTTKSPAVYARTLDYYNKDKIKRSFVQKFSKRNMSIRCIISQPGTIIKKKYWDKVGGLDKKLNLAFDYDLWWKLYNKFGDLSFYDDVVAVNRVHRKTKTINFRSDHYKEAIAVVKKYNHYVPLKWYLYWPYAVWLRKVFKF